MRPHLLEFELAWCSATFETFHPEGTALGHGIGKMQPARFFDDALARIPLEQSVGMRFALWMIALAPLFVLGRFATITSLRENDRARLLEKLLASPIYAVRQLVLAIKAIGIMLYAQSPEIRSAMYARRGEVVRLRLRGAHEQQHAAE